MSNGCVHYQFSCTLKLARKYEIEHWPQSSKTINWSAGSFQINHVTSMSWHMNPRYGHVILILVSGYPVLTAVNDHFGNVPYTRCGLAKTHLRHPSLPFDSLPYPILTTCRRVNTLSQSRDNQTERGWLYSMSGSPAITEQTHGNMESILFYTMIRRKKDRYTYLPRTAWLFKDLF